MQRLRVSIPPLAPGERKWRKMIIKLYLIYMYLSMLSSEVGFCIDVHRGLCFMLLQGGSVRLASLNKPVQTVSFQEKKFERQFSCQYSEHSYCVNGLCFIGRYAISPTCHLCRLAIGDTFTEGKYVKVNTTLLIKLYRNYKDCLML